MLVFWFLFLRFFEGNYLAKLLGVFLELELDPGVLFAVLGRPVCFAGFFVGQFDEIILWHSGKTIAESPFLRNCI